MDIHTNALMGRDVSISIHLGSSRGARPARQRRRAAPTVSRAAKLAGGAPEWLGHRRAGAKVRLCLLENGNSGRAPDSDADRKSAWHLHTLGAIGQHVCLDETPVPACRARWARVPASARARTNSGDTPRSAAAAVVVRYGTPILSASARLALTAVSVWRRRHASDPLGLRRAMPLLSCVGPVAHAGEGASTVHDRFRGAGLRPSHGLGA